MATMTSPRRKPKNSGRGIHPVILELFRYRKRLGKSQQEFANDLGISISTLRNWEQGQTWPDKSTARFIELFLADKK